MTSAVPTGVKPPGIDEDEATRMLLTYIRPVDPLKVMTRWFHRVGSRAFGTGLLISDPRALLKFTVAPLGSPYIQTCQFVAPLGAVDPLPMRSSVESGPSACGGLNHSSIEPSPGNALSGAEGMEM